MSLPHLKSTSFRITTPTVSVLSDMVFAFARSIAPEEPVVRLRVEFAEHIIVLIVRDTFLRQVCATDCPTREEHAADCTLVFPDAKSFSVEIRATGDDDVTRIKLESGKKAVNHANI